MAFPLALFAQGIGFRAGLNLARWGGDDVEISNFRAGYHFGVFYQASLSEKLKLEPGISFSAKGTYSEFEERFPLTDATTLTITDQVNVRASYLELPVTFKYFVHPKLYLLVNPIISFHLKTKYEMTFVQCIGESCTGEREEEELDEIRDVDFGLGFGLGYHITDHIFISTNYQLGLLSLDEEGEGDVFNRVQAFSIGYKF